MIAAGPGDSPCDTPDPAGWAGSAQPCGTRWRRPSSSTHRRRAASHLSASAPSVDRRSGTMVTARRSVVKGPVSTASPSLIQIARRAVPTMPSSRVHAAIRTPDTAHDLNPVAGATLGTQRLPKRSAKCDESRNCESCCHSSSVARPLANQLKSRLTIIDHLRHIIHDHGR